MKILYTAHGSATGGREGQAATDTGNVKLVLNTPRKPAAVAARAPIPSSSSPWAIPPASSVH